MFGLTEEALKCCEEIFCDEPYRDISKDRDHQAVESFHSSNESNPPDGPLKRTVIHVDFELRGGRTMTVSAVTFVWNRSSIGLK